MIHAELHIQSFAVPDGLIGSVVDDKMFLTYDTPYKRNDDPVEFQVELDLNSKIMVWNMLGSRIDQMESLGVHRVFKLNAHWIESLVRVMKELRICFGREASVEAAKKKSPTMIVEWEKTEFDTQYNNFTVQRFQHLQSNRCYMVLPFTGLKTTSSCRNCQHDVPQKVGGQKQKNFVSSELVPGGLTNPEDKYMTKIKTEPPAAHVSFQHANI